MSRDRAAARHANRMSIATAALNLLPATTLATPLERGLSDCPCKKDCGLHGDCRLCVAFHLTSNELPKCQRRRSFLPWS